MDNIDKLITSLLANIELTEIKIQDTKTFAEDIRGLIQKHSKPLETSMNRSEKEKLINDIKQELANIEQLNAEHNYLKAEHDFQNGENYYLGLNGCFKDENIALNYFSKALDGGYFKAAKPLGDIYYNENNIDKALSMYMLGADNGRCENYAQLGFIYHIEEGYIDKYNATLAWSKFFANIEQMENEGDSYMLPIYFYLYLYGSVINSSTIDIIRHLPIMSPYKLQLQDYYQKQKANSHACHQQDVYNEIEIYINMIK